MRQEHPPSFFEQLMGELQRLCQQGDSGTLFVTTEDSHSARFALKDGAIVSINYRTKNGLDAIPFIRKIKTGTYSFSNANVFRSGATSAPLPATSEIFHLLGVTPKDSFHRPLPARPVTAHPATNSVSIPITHGVALTAPSPFVAKPVAPAATGRRTIPAKKILVVEDSTTTRKVIVKILKDSGYAVLEAENGLAAFAQLSETNPDLMLLDIVMPGIDGYKVLSMIRKHDTFKNLPVIMLTSRDSLLDKLRGKLGGSDEYLTKPFTAEQLLEKISKYHER